jgi:pyruvate/2-oxoacid:ferredoxin oxidoreductase beta subunit/Pyruvate/2-oxoacid:ferredoxin oxidoreductase gamma subunit
MSDGYVSANHLPYCKGCSHALVLRALGSALEQLSLPPEDVAIVTDIGCVGLADAHFTTPHTVHTTHGRSTAFATGLALADAVLGPARLKPVVLIGDGGAMIGLLHLVNAALLNSDVTVLVHNNFLFGMTGGQNSAFSPLDFVTSTTRHGNTTPPLDLARVLLASRASFVARKLASDRDLADVIARAIAHPGFAMVEVLELCTAYATRWNPLTGADLKQVAARAGYELGVLHDQRRPSFGETYRAQRAPHEPGPAPNSTARFSTPLAQPVGLVVAGTAGEHVQSAATLLARAASAAGLYVTQKNDNPVTQGTGFSVSELILSPREILFTGIEAPEGVLVVSPDGAQELERNAVLARLAPHTLVLADEQVPLPPLPCRIERLPFRAAAGAKHAALAAIAEWLARSGVLPLEALWAALEARGSEAQTVRAAVERVKQALSSRVRNL